MLIRLLTKNNHKRIHHLQEKNLKKKGENKSSSRNSIINFQTSMPFDSILQPFYRHLH